MSDPGKLAETIRDLREQAGLSQLGLARKARMSVGYVNDLEHGRKRSPSAPMRRKLATALGCRISDLAA